MPENTRKREHIVDILKGICILLVCFTHYSWDSMERRRLMFPWWVDMAVPTFMILTGYIYGRLNDKNTYPPPKILWNKALRLTVPVLIIYTMTILWDFNRYGKLPYELINTFMQGGRGQGAYYYPVMMQTIFVLPILDGIIKRKTEKGLLICLIMNVVYEVLHVAYLLPVESYRLLMFRYVFLLASGSYIALRKPVKWIYPVGMFVTGALFLDAYLKGRYKPLFLIHWTGTSFVAAMYIIPIVWLILRKCRFSFGPLELIGKASYHIFLTQMWYYYCISQYVYQNIENRTIQLLISMGISVLTGILFYYLETPLTRWIKKNTEILFSA